MLFESKCNDTNSKIVHETTTTFVNEETTVHSLLILKKLQNDFLEVLPGEPFTNAVLLGSDVEVFKQIKFGDLQNTFQMWNASLESSSKVITNLQKLFISFVKQKREP